jgi:hypothetical protein
VRKLDALISRLNSFGADVNEIMEKVVRENEDIIVEMNSEDQLFEKGITSTGVEISSYAPYQPMTLEIKQGKGQPTDRVTLRDERDFHRSFYIEFKSEGFQIKASDSKADELIFEYGPEIMGLSEENRIDLLHNYFLPAIIKYYKQ